MGAILFAFGQLWQVFALQDGEYIPATAFETEPDRQAIGQAVESVPRSKIAQVGAVDQYDVDSVNYIRTVALLGVGVSGMLWALRSLH